VKKFNSRDSDRREDGKLKGFSQRLARQKRRGAVQGAVSFARIELKKAKIGSRSVEERFGSG